MTPPARQVLKTWAHGPWLMLIGDHWVVGKRAADAVPLEEGRAGLVPLVLRPRDEVEAEARAHLTATDPDLSEPFSAMIATVLWWRRDYYLAPLVGWLRAEEVLAFANGLRDIVLTKGGTQATRHAIKRLLKQHGVWATHHGEAGIETA